MKKLLIPILILTVLLIAGCQCETNGMSKQETAIYKGDPTICLSASLPDVCLESYVRETDDLDACRYVKAINGKEKCQMYADCGQPGERCCNSGSIDCREGSICQDGKCYSCGLKGQPACMRDGGFLCYDGLFPSDDGRCIECGSSGAPCCEGGLCDLQSTCQAGKCVACGAAGQDCCDGTCWEKWQICSGSTCVSCGQELEACCTNGVSFACDSFLECRDNICRFDK